MRQTSYLHLRSSPTFLGIRLSTSRSRHPQRSTTPELHLTVSKEWNDAQNRATDKLCVDFEARVVGVYPNMKCYVNYFS